MKTQWKRVGTILISLLLFAALLAGCAGSDNGSVSEAHAPVQTESVREDDDSENNGGPDENPDDGFAWADYLYENAATALMGTTSAGEDVVFIETTDGYGALAFVNAAMESVSFVGEVNAHDDAQISITDENSGITFAFEITEVYEDGSFIADIGDLGEIGFEIVDSEVAVTALVVINEATKAVA